MQTEQLKPRKLLVLFLFVWKIVALYIVDVLLNSLGYRFMQIKILSQEAWFEFGVYAQQVMHDQHLAITIFASSNANNGYANRFCHFFGERCRDFFQDYRKTARLLQLKGV